MLISIEGNIGTGKSTLVKILKEKFNRNTNVKFLQEPVDQWLKLTDSDGTNILDKFYKDQKRWSYSFQMNAFITRVKDIISSDPEKNIVFAERSVLTDRKVFAKLLMESGDISEIEWKLYNQWYTWLNSSFKTEPNKIIYLRAEPEISYKRIKKRNREEEKSIKLEYIKGVHKKHDNWLNNDPSVLVIDWNEDFENNQEKLEQIFRFIQTNIKPI
jgi:deoxyadenosine/deoxycytidine kinase